MTELVHFETSTGSVVVEVGDGEPGYERVDRSGVIAHARTKLDAALGDVRDAAENAFRTLRASTTRPDSIEVEFGVKLTAEAGAVIAKTAMEGHFKVRLAWSSASVESEDDTEAEPPSA